MTEEVLIRISLSDDIPSRHPDNAPGQDHGSSRKIGTDLRSRSVPIFAYIVQQVFVLKRRAVLWEPIFSPV